ncbi:MAG TPA: hypothetical protein VJZ00_14820 [Thermoanaerobaculia bacterium]|nr:hypothetical protein [Thermoanaerobaculia bacterium]
MKRGAAIAVLLFASLARAEPRAVFVAQPGRIVAALLPVSLLDEREVKKQLGSGLTTTFLLVAQQREGDQRGATRIEVRYDLWDEVWLVRRIETDGRDDRQRLASREALEKWWRAPVRLFAANEDRVMLKVTLTVLPFSVAEGEDARQWIAKSGSLGAPGATSPLVTALIGTTISAKPIRSYHWSADISFK